MLASIKQADGAPASQVYYGLLAYTDPNGNGYPRTINGIGLLGNRVALGVDYTTAPGSTTDGTGALAGHEIGHTFGRPHAPCGSVEGEDKAFPHKYAAIGGNGIDFKEMVVKSAQAPDYARDVMSYCQPWWVSDYTYTRLFDDQRLHGSTTSAARPQPSLMIRGIIDADQQAHLDPVYALLAAPDQPVA
jgi:hypothetical protein